MRDIDTDSFVYVVHIYLSGVLAPRPLHRSWAHSDQQKTSHQALKTSKP